MTNEVGIRELKNGASGYIERAEHGEVITVTRRGSRSHESSPSRCRLAWLGSWPIAG